MRTWRKKSLAIAALAGLVSGPAGTPTILSAAGRARSDHDHDGARTATPIKHVIVIIGENRTFDHVYATYKPKEGETVSNLLSKGIVKANGKPGPNYSLSAQFSAVDSTTAGTGTFSNSPQSKSIYSTLPPALAGGNSTVSSCCRCSNSGRAASTA